MTTTKQYAWILNPLDARFKPREPRLDYYYPATKWSVAESNGLFIQRGAAAQAFNQLRTAPFTIEDVRKQLQANVADFKAKIASPHHKHVRGLHTVHVQAREAMLKLGDTNLGYLLVALIPAPAYAAVAGVKRHFNHPAAKSLTATTEVGSGANPAAIAEANEDLAADPAFTGEANGPSQAGVLFEQHRGKVLLAAGGLLLGVIALAIGTAAKGD